MINWCIFSLMMTSWFRRTQNQLQKAAIYDHKSIQNIRMTSIKIPSIRPGYSLVRVFSAGLNPVDAKMIIGDKVSESVAPYFTRIFTNYVVGFDFSGQIVETTSADFMPGDCVFGFNYQLPPIGSGSLGGTLQEYALVPNHEIWKKPESLTFEQAAALPIVGVTALQAFEQHDVRPGQKILVIGASGGTGHIATSILTKKGIETVAICSTSNVKFVQSLGNDLTVLDYTADDFMEQLDSYVDRKGKFDFVFDTVSSADSRDKEADYQNRIRSHNLIKKYGSPGEGDGSEVDKHNYVTLGGDFGSWWTALMKRLLNINWFSRGFELFWIKMDHSCDYLKELRKLCDEQGLCPEVSTVPFTEEGCRSAFKSLHPPKNEKRSTRGKIVVNVYNPDNGNDDNDYGHDN